MITAQKELRRNRRISCASPVRISWEEYGQPRFAMAKCLDISESGLCIESPHTVRPGTAIQLGAERLNLAGAAAVKHSTRVGGKFVLGVQLTQSIRPEKLAVLEGRPVVTLLIENFNRIHQKD